MMIKKQSRVVAVLDELSQQGTETVINLGTMAGTLAKKGMYAEADAVKRRCEAISSTYHREIDTVIDALEQSRKNTSLAAMPQDTFPELRKQAMIVQSYEMYKALQKRNQALSKLLSETSKQYPSIDSLPDVPIPQERIEKSLGELGNAIREAFGKNASREEQERMVSKYMKTLENRLPNTIANISVLGNPTKQHIKSR